ncbi:predicted protein [Naegleria gruberi]|uniref:Predicted protein n=1 Tax=Naegleria gruberi TaxID=5762 RepID=D2VTH7_NAEGR|nr:uncharacterized protein NAEGRDRAFT_52122 [Naegleria gruberi]EFC39860.1 predicted protein [Naegleria gruberi]|eukprot:XP_002672604.1 predicted protein [Naegleria gruberi strain NEG-M]
MDEIFDRNDGDINCEMESVVESFKGCPKNGWNSVLDQYSYKVYANLWINYPKLREIFAKSLIVFVPVEVIVNYDQFFRLINKGEISMNQLKFIRIQGDRTRELKLEIGNESFLLVDVKKYTTLGNRQARLRRWQELNSNAKFGIVIQSLISFDHPFEFSEYEFFDSIGIIKEYLTHKASKELRIVFMFTMADLLYEKSTFQSKNLKEPTRDRIELKHIGNMNKERDLINSVLDFYQNVFETFRENEKFEYHIINNLSTDESYQALIESNKENDDPTKQVIISRSLIRRSLGVLYKMIGQSQLSDEVEIDIGDDMDDDPIQPVTHQSSGGYDPEFEEMKKKFKKPTGASEGCVNCIMKEYMKTKANTEKFGIGANPDNVSYELLQFNSSWAFKEDNFESHFDLELYVFVG